MFHCYCVTAIIKRREKYKALGAGNEYVLKGVNFSHCESDLPSQFTHFFSISVRSEFRGNRVATRIHGTFISCIIRFIGYMLVIRSGIHLERGRITLFICLKALGFNIYKVRALRAKP